MVTDKQVRRLMELLGKGKNLCSSAAKADMDEKTARKYRDLNKLPSEIKADHTWPALKSEKNDGNGMKLGGTIFR